MNGIVNFLMLHLQSIMGMGTTITQKKKKKSHSQTKIIK